MRRRCFVYVRHVNVVEILRDKRYRREEGYFDVMTQRSLSELGIATTLHIPSFLSKLLYTMKLDHEISRYVQSLVLFV